MTPPATIRARVHPDALARLPRMFTASPRGMLNELFQNARRAGARHIHVNIQGNRVAVHDDGTGIDDPQALLSFGYSGWQADLDEDPAGMGFAALARTGCEVRSTYASGVPWQVSLAPQAFLGKGPDVPVETPDHSPAPGTHVFFNMPPDTAVVWPNAIRAAALHLPVTVLLTVDDEDMDVYQEDFLNGAVYVEDANVHGLQNVRIGVFRNRLPGTQDHHLNVMGLQPDFQAPTLHTASTPTEAESSSQIYYPDVWSTRVDVTGKADGLELVLPQRLKLVDNGFTQTLHGLCYNAIYRALQQAQGNLHFNADVLKAARQAGIHLQPPRPMLRRWHPQTAADDTPRMVYGRPQTFHSLPDDAFVVSPLEATTAQTLYHALHEAGMLHRVFAADDGMQGIDWYDRLPRAGNVSAIVQTTDGTWHDADNAPALDRRARDAQVKLPGLDLVLPTRIVCLGDAYAWWYDDHSFPVACEGYDVSTEELVKTAIGAYFCPSDDWDADSVESQAYAFENNARDYAITHLEGREKAWEEERRRTLTQHVLPMLKPDAVLDIRIERSADNPITFQLT